MPESKHDMRSIIHPVNLLVDMEYGRAALLHEKVFASTHEGYGVIAEEVQEAQECLDRVQEVMMQLLKAIRNDDNGNMIDLSDYIRDTAVSGAAELIQVAAMCRKMVGTLGGSE